MERLRPETTVLLVVDVQERLCAAMPPDALARLLANAKILVEAARVVGARLLVSEQYPKGLGPTHPDLAAKLAELGVQPIDKLTFDASSEPRIAHALAASDPRAVVVVGMEAHVCVYQTARELVTRGYATYVVADAVTSRREENRLAGLALCTSAGAITTTTEAVVFDWVERAGTDAFRQISKLVR
jgi:nicotinamidase-related amidase